MLPGILVPLNISFHDKTRPEIHIVPDRNNHTAARNDPLPRGVSIKVNGHWSGAFFSSHD
jgi:hypothetical protein